MFLKNFIKPKDDTIRITATIQDAVDLMSKNKLHRVVIVENKKAVALLSEKDILELFNNHVDFNSSALQYANKNLIALHSTRLIQYALSIMVDNNIRKIIVINSKKEYLGCVEQEEIVYRFEEELHSENSNIEHLLNSSNLAFVIDENKTLHHALNTMSTNRVNSLLISRNNKAIGIISESDIVLLAQKNINQKEPVSKFMHSPLISIDSSKNISDMIHLMKENTIRRVVVKTNVDENYHIINSKDLANNLKGNYTQFLESKLFDTRDTFNSLSESIIEIVDFDDEQVIYWTNSITKENFSINIDDNITRIIPEKLWKPLFKSLLENRFIFQTIQIGEQYFNIKGHYGTLLENNIIKLFLYDITEISSLNNTLKEQNKMQEQLLFDQQKMVQMGEMISNIVHQWRQPLSAISATTSSMQVQKEFATLSDEKFDELSQSIIVNVEYLSNTMDTFRNFIKEKKVKKELVVEERIKNTIDIIKFTLKNNYIELVNNVDFSKQTYTTMFSGELDQVLINIFNNAKDALLENNITNPRIELNFVNKKEKAIITIEDNAGGIPLDIIEKIFDENFTTKDISKGTGIGLYMSYKIIKESFNGKLYVQNTPNGAKFFIEFPLS